MHARAAAQLPPPVLSPSPGAATTVVYSTAVETGDVIYVADGNGDPSTANGSSSSSIAQSSTQPPVVVYSPADGPSTDNRTVARTPNPMYQPASNNMYDAGVVSSNSDSNSNA
eukprot:gene1809-8142_t